MPAVVAARRRVAGAGRRPRLRFTDRLVLTLAHLRLGVPHEALAVAFEVDRSTVTRAIGQVRPLLAGRGCALASGVRLRTLADVFSYAAAEGVTLRLDATEVRVRRPRAGRAGRKAFVSGKLKQNTIKATIVSDEHGSTLFAGGCCPGRMHDTTAARVEGIDALLDAYPQVKVLVDAGYQGVAREHPEQVSAPPLKLRPGRCAGPTGSRGNRTLRAVVAAYPGRTCHRGVDVVAATATLHRPPRGATRNHRRSRRPCLRSHDHPVIGTRHPRSLRHPLLHTRWSSGLGAGR